MGQDKKPNILFIFADDQSFETIHELGNSEIQTPTLDRMVRDGTTFTHAFNMGSWSGAVCVASRMMLNSGRFVCRANKFHAKSKEEQKIEEDAKDEPNEKGNQVNVLFRLLNKTLMRIMNSLYPLIYLFFK